MKKNLPIKNSVLITIFLSLFFTIGVNQFAFSQNWQLINPTYPTTDDIVAGYSVANFGATGDGVTDVTSIFQNQLNALGAIGGGTLWVPAGKYVISGNLTIPKGVTLRGDWQQPVPGQPITGTILMAYAGRGDTTAAAFITEQTACAVMDIAIWYPQQLPSNITPYPAAILMGAPGFWGNDFNNAKNITLVNAYDGIAISELNGGGCPIMNGIYGTPLSTGIMIDNIADVGRLENIDFSAAYWEGSGLPNAPAVGSSVEGWIYQNGTGITMRRDDWTYSSFISVKGYKTGFEAAPSITTVGAIANGHNYGMTFTNCNNGIVLDGVSGVGIMFANVTMSNCVNGVIIGPGSSVASTNGAAQFHTCTIAATGNAVYTNPSSVARLMMEHCTISSGKVDIGGGTYMASDCDFNNAVPQTILEKNSRAILTTNRYQTTRSIQNNSLWISAIDSTSTFTLKAMPAFPTIVPETHQAARQAMYLATASPYNAKNDGTTDNTTAIQSALNAASAAGGGIVFLPPGHYLVAGDLMVPTGVELKGAADVSAAPYGPGSVLEVTADQGNANGTPFLKLSANSGVRGIVFDYPNQMGSLVPNFPAYPYTIQVTGSNAYIINIGFRSVYNGVDLFTNKCDNHYLDYVCGQVFQNVFTVGGGSAGGKIYNAHFNTIYYANGTESKFGTWPNSPSTDGDPAVYNYNYDNCKFLNLGNCQNETLYNDFIYGSQQGINLNSDAGSAPTGVSLGLGIDGTRNSMNFNAIGAAGFDFINTQTVALGDAGNRYITTTPTFASQNTTLFNSDYWGNPPNGIILNGGTLNLQAANFSQPGQTNFGQLTSGLLNIFGSAIWPVNAELNAGAEHLLNAESSIIDSSNIIRPNVALWKDNLGNAWAVNPIKAMPRTGWSATASVDNGEAQNALDSNETTRWATTGPQTPGQSYTVDMKNLKQFYQIALENANSSGDYPVGYAVYVSTDGINWGSPIATGAGTSGLTIITFPTQVARYIKVVQTGSTSFGWWSIFEFYVFGVDYHAATSVTVSPTTATINIGATQKLTATILPANASDTAVTWVSSDPTKATVDSTGLVTGVAVGSVTITVTTHDGSKTATSTITVTGSESPYGGTPWPIPGTIQSEDYDNGGQGIAYNDSDPTNNGGQYRPTGGVDIEASADGGYDVGWTVAGEWMSYTVNVITSGVYTMQSRVASTSTTGAFHVTMDGTNISGTVSVPNTGNFQYWQTVNTTTTYLTAGQHIMTVFIDAAGFNINYLSFVGPVTAGLTVNIAAPLNNVIYNAPAALPLTANVATSTGTITKVDFFENGTQVGETTSAPYTFNWTGVAAGTYIITAEVTNSSGGTSTSAPVSVTVNAAIPSCPLLTWSDEFNGNSLDLTKWNYQTGNGCPGICGWGNNELEYYTNNTNNVSVSGGALALTAQYQPNYNGSGNNYTSGKLVTLGNFSQKYGHFEARIKMPSAAGTWPAFWMLADSTAWPSTGEIDIEEAANKNPVTWFGTLHFANAGGSHLSQGYTYNSLVALSNDYHLYAADWTTDSISFYIDSVLRGTVSKTALIAAGGVWPFDSQKFYIIMNLAVGGNFTGQTPDPTQFPQSMLVDYVRVYSKNPCTGIPETPYGGTPWPIPGTIQAENYDNGGQGLAYNDSDPTNDGGQYRTTEGVDVETCSDAGTGYDVGYTAAGEWENYTVQVNTAGVYTLQARVAANSAGNSLHVEMDGVNISGSISVPNTGGFQTWQTVSVTTPALTVGQHIMRIYMETGGFNLNYVTFLLPTPIPVITSSNTASGTVGTPITNYTIAASNTPTSFAVTNLPAGLSLNTTTGVISGTPTVAGTFIDTIKAINAGGTGTQVVTFTIAAGTLENDLTQKLMMGYQGWFLAQGDNSEPNDWRHWFHSTTDPSAGQLNFDLFPDLTEYKTMYPTSMVYSSGAPVKLYSSHDSSTVNTHFRWMQQYNIYGVYLQRFLGEVVNDPRFFAVRNDVTKNVANASQIYGRHYAIMYDISGVPDDGTLYTKLVKDWQYLVDSQNITTQSVYVKQKGLPVVAIWGIGFAGRGLKVSTFDSLINYFHYLAPAKYRAYVVGGVPGQWRTLDGDSETDTSWTSVYHSLDMISPWAVGRYSDNTGADNWKTQRIVPDLADCNTNNVNYMPVIFPGFSWMNENGGTLNQIPRNGGNFYWHQAYNAKSAGSNFIYVAMFDEVDEGTAMLKAAPTHATVPTTGTYLTLDADGYNCLPSDWYLQLANETQKMLDGTSPTSSTIPINPNRCDTVSIISSGTMSTGGAPGTFTITGSNVASTITVNYTISGTAPSTDYTASPVLSGSVTLTAAAPSATISITALTLSQSSETLTITLSTATTYTAGALPATLTILNTAPSGCSTSMVVNATSVPTIDGTVDAVWNNAPKNAITKTIQGTIQTGSTWQAMYDATNLYVLVQVKDANLSNIGTNIYDQDGVELFIAGNNNKTGTYTANDHQYRFNWNEPATIANITGNTGSTTGISYAIPSSTGGYTLEVAIPWTTIGGTAPSNGKPIGFDVNINDQQNNLTTREAIAGWNGTATDDFNNPADFGTVNLTVCASTTPVVTSATTASGTVNTSFSYSITATNTPTSYAIGGTLPAGLTLNTSTGVISGTPTAAGTFIDTVKAINSGGTGTQVLTITINPAQPVVSSNVVSGTVGAVFNYTISATNSPTSYNATGLPGGLTINTGTGVISGTPTTAGGPTTVTITATNAGGTGSGTVAITINPAKPVVATASTTGTVGTVFSYTISATNSPASYGSTTLPAGLSLNTTTGVISGTPTTAGTFTVTDTAKNISGSGTGTLTITINPAKPVVATASTTGTVGTVFSYTISATNNPTSYGSTTLPAGLSLNTTTGAITGTPTTAGTFTVTDTAKNISGSGTGTLTITINPAKPVVATASTTGTVGAAFSYTISATNNPTSYGSTILPAGLSLNTTTGVISGTPTIVGTFTITDTAKNISGSGTGTLTITINPAIPVVATASTTGTVGVSFSYTISATNNPTSYGSTTLPAGLSLNTTTGVISGTPTVVGTFTITDTAKNISGSGTGTLTITINPALPVVTSTSVNGTTGVAFSYTIAATNNPTSYGASALPGGLTFNSTTGTISGTPTTAGTFTISDTARNITGFGVGTLTITITTTVPPAPVVTSGSTTGTVGNSFSYTIVATNSPTGYSSTTLPAGLSLNSSGIISGIPTVAGTFTITDTAKNAGGSGTGTLTITINPAKPIVTIASTTGTVGTAFSYTINATNSPTSYSSTTLPAGLSLNTTTGAITGTPTTTGTFTITDTAKNISGSGTGTLTITINPAKPVVATASTTGTVGVSFSYTISATNNPTSYGSTTLPAGLSLNTSTGAITGTPTTAGTFTITDTAKNISGSGTGTLTITINPAKPVVATASTTGTVGTTFTYTIGATNSPTGYGSTTLPTGLSLNTTTGVISGTPTTTGTFTITDTAKNISGSGTGTLTITINPAKPVVAAASTTGTVGVSFSYTISATNNPTSYGSTTLPVGLSLNTTTGVISGTPTVAGTFTITDTAKNISGSGTGTLTITINPAKPVVATASTTGTVGTTFTYTIGATNSPTGYGSTTLPTGLSLNTTTGVISGTPTTAGTFTITDTAKNISGSGTGTLTITINPAKPVVAIASTTGTVGTAFSYTISATNNPTSYSSTTLPAGLSLNTITGVISGTPTTAGTFTVTDTAKNISGSGTGTLTITINPAIPVVAIASTTGMVGAAFSYTISATNSPTSYSSTTLPAGLSLNTITGVISGTSTTAGTFTVTDTAKNISGSGTGTLTITINPAIPVVTSTSVNGTTGVAFSYTIVATNNSTSYGSTTLPAGLSLNMTTGTISGTPTTAGTFTISDTARNITGFGVGTLTITITTTVPPAPVVTSGSTTGTVGNSFSYTIVATNSPTGYSSTTLPAGLSINSSGVISGIPTVAGTFTITDTAKNAGGSGTGTLTITINPAKPVVATASTTGTVGTAFTYTISATNSPTSYSSTILPAGLSLNTTTGVISGTPTTAGTFTVTDTAKNISGSGTGTLTITINPAKPVVATASTTGTVGVSFSYTISATNNPTSYSSTTLPAGLSLNTATGVITGTPTVAGTFTITDTAKNISGSGTGTLTITINPALPAIPVITSLSTAVGTIGTAFSYNITATNTPTSYGSTTLPIGLSLNTVTGAITGAPSVSGTFADTIKATNAAGTGIEVLTITINSLPGIPVITSNGAVSGIVGTSFDYSITTNVPVLSYNAVNLPAGLSINTATGEITGVPTTIDTTKVTITATNASGTTNNILTISIIAPPIPMITSADTATATEGESFTYNIDASNAPTNYGATGLPNGLTIDPATGIISGIPTTSGTFNATLTATNAFGTATEVLTLTVNAHVVGVPVLMPNPVTDGHFRLTLPGWSEGESVNIEIRDFIGMLVQRGTAVISDGYITINVPGLIAGNYVVIAMDANKKIVKKFTVK